MAIIECVPNISEGRRPEIVTAIAEALSGVSGVRLLDVSSDPSHHRSVLTLAGDADGLKTAILTLFERALPAIDLRAHTGEHPRLGAVDVVPFVPLAGARMEDCVALARQTGAEVARRYDLPVFLYEEAATAPERRNLEDIRRGGFEGLTAKMASPGWAPDFGPSTPHPTAGAAVFGARKPLVAFNVNLATERLDVAHRIARAVRHSSGGLRFVKAMAVRLHDRRQVQVSMNLTDVEHSPIHRVVELIRREAARDGVAIAGCEVVGLIPQAALVAAADFYLQLDGFDPRQILERRLAAEPD